MFQHLKLLLNDRVMLINLDAETNGMMGTIKGKSFEHVIDTYIVLLDKPSTQRSHISRDYDVEAICVPECCLERIK